MLRPDPMCPKVAPEYLARRRRQILDAGLACFTRDGYLGTSIEAIASECGLSVGSIYKYFPSKDVLFQEVAAEQLDIFDTEVLLATAGTHTAGAALRIAIQHFLQRVAVEGEAWGPIYFEFLVQSRQQSELGAPLQAMAGQRLERTARLVELASAAGELRPGLDPLATAATITAVLEGYALQVATKQPTVASDELLAAITALLAADGVSL